MSDPLLIEVLESVIQDITRRVRADLLAEVRAIPAAPHGYLAPQAAAEYLGVKRKRIYDLKSSGALLPDGYDGRTPLFKHSTLDAYVSGES